MCIAIPMQVISAAPLQAEVRGRGRHEVADLRLVGPCRAGDWLLVFHGAARERIDAARAAEVNAALDLLEAGLAGDSEHATREDPGFALPSQMSAAELAALTARPGR